MSLGKRILAVQLTIALIAQLVAWQAPVRVCTALLCDGIIRASIETQAIGQTIVSSGATSADSERRVARRKLGRQLVAGCIIAYRRYKIRESS